MRRSTLVLVVLVVALALLPLSPARAERPDRLPADLELAVRQMEGLLADLSGIGDVEPVFKDHGAGIYSVSIELPEGRPEVAASAAALGPLTVLCAGHQLTDPSSLKTTFQPIESNLNAAYNFWWGYVNTGNEATRKTINTIKGPGTNFRRTDNLTYAGGAIGLFFFNVDDVFTEVGTFTQKTKAAKGGSAKAKTWAQ